MFMCFKGSPVSSAPPLRPRGGSLRPPCSLRGPWGGGCQVKAVNLSIVGDMTVVEGVRCRRLDPTG